MTSALCRLACARWLWPVAAIVAVLVEVGVLHSTAATGVAPYYPRAYDQVEYLTESYLAYDKLRERGLIVGVAQTLVEPRVQGWTLQLEAGLLFLLTGPRRLAALDLNIGHLVAFLGMTGTLVWRAWGVAPALVFAALIVGASSVTQLTGGVFDFRLDFATWCLWGMLLGVLALSNPGRLARWRHLAALIVLGELFIATRTLGFLYLCALAATLVALTRVAAARRALLVALAIWSITEAAFLWQNWQLVHDYYLLGHVLSTEGDVRASALGVGDLISRLAFYPRSVLVDHLGPGSELLLALTVAIALLLTVGVLIGDRRAARKSSELLGAGRSADRTGRPGLGWSVMVLASGLVVPLAALTLDRDRSTVVGSILLPAVVLLAVVGFGAASARLRDARIQGLLVVFGMLCLVGGLAGQALGLRRSGPEFAPDGDAARASLFILGLADWVAQQRGGQAVWSMDAHLDFGSVQVTRVFYYEQRGVWLSLSAGIGEGNIASSLSADEVRAQALPSDVLILTQRTTAPPPPYPYDLSLEGARSILTALATDQFEPATRGEFFGRQAIGYVRR